MQDLRRQVGVLPHMMTKGLDNVIDIAKVSPLKICSLDEAMTTTWPTEALFVPYRPLKHKGDYPRCNKPALPQLRAEGEDLITDMLVFDYDLPEGRDWHLGEFDDWLRCFAELSQGPLEWVSKWRYLYSTAHGSRIVYVLDQNIGMEDSEGYHRWVVKELQKERLTLCPKCSDWTHIFRLPYIARDGKNTWEQHYCKSLVQKDTVLDISLIDKEESRTSPIYAYVPKLDIPQPNVEEVSELLLDTPLISKVKRKLKDKPVYPVLFDHVLLAEENRNSTITSFVGTVIREMFRTEGITPQIIYALFLDPVLQLPESRKTPDRTVMVWDVILRMWAKEESKLEAQRERIKKEMARGEESLVDIKDRMKLWCDHPGLYDHDALEWVKQHLIANSGKSFFVMQANGYYDSLSLGKDQLASRTKITGMEGAVMLKEPNQTGNGWKKMTIPDVLAQHSTCIASIEARPELPGGTILGMDTARASLLVNSYRRNPGLAGEYNKEVDIWLHCLFGDCYEKAIRWIAWSLAFEEGPICALSLAGARGSGKKVFVQGLSECLEVPSLASSKDLVGTYQYGLLTSPFLVVNEGWPKAQQGMHPADKFRELVSGDPLTIRIMYRDPIKAINLVRIIFTANNQEVIKVLSAGRDMTPEDRNALSQRLFHVDYDNSASEYFLSLGGVEYTGRVGGRWIAADGGGESDYVVARHFLYLYENRRSLGETGKRFLVEGEDNDEIMFSMMTQSGSSPLIIETILNMINANAKRPGMVVRQEEGRVFVLANEILKESRSEKQGRDSVTMAKIDNTLKGITLTTPHKRGFILDEKKGMGQKRWHELDLDILHDVANRDGWQCDLLTTLIKNKEKK